MYITTAGHGPLPSGRNSDAGQTPSGAFTFTTVLNLPPVYRNRRGSAPRPVNPMTASVRNFEVMTYETSIGDVGNGTLPHRASHLLAVHGVSARPRDAHRKPLRQLR